MLKRIFTSESVTEGHPDKVCDQISDGVLDAILARDPMARVACETVATTGMVLVTGEISCDCYVDIAQVARRTLNQIGYDSAESGFNGNTCAVLTAIDEQSKDIAMGVDSLIVFLLEMILMIVSNTSATTTIGTMVSSILVLIFFTFIKNLHVSPFFCVPKSQSASIKIIAHKY